MHVYKDGDLIITDGALKWGGQNLAKLTIGACDDGDIPLAGTILHSMKIYAAKLSEADVGLETERSDYASLSWVASFDGNNSMVGWITNWDGESTLAYINTPNAQGGVIASGCHPYKGYTLNQPFTIALYANIADVDVGTAANGAALIALGKPGESNQGAGNLVLAKTAVDKVALSRSGTKLVEITDEDLAAADSYHLFVFGMDAEGNTFLSVDGEKKQSESPTTYPEAGLQIGSMYTGIGSYIQAYGMIVDEIRGYSAYLNDDDLAKLATRFPAESRSISDSSLMYNWTGKNSGKLYTLSSPVVMPSADITSFTATVQYKNGNSRIEIAGVKLVDGEGNEFIGATNGDGASFTGGNSGNNVYTFTNNAGFSGDFYTLYATLWVNGSTGTGHITLSEGVTFNDLFTESETGSIIMPAQRLSANEGNVTIPSGFALTVQGGDSEVEIAKVITVDGSLTTMGALNFSAANRVAAGGTLEVATGETKFNLAGSGFSGKLKVASGATFKNGTNDGPNYNGAPVLDIAGTLEVTETARWSLGVNSQTILRDGAVLKGAGGTGYDYAFDYFNGATITVDGNATIEGNIGAHLAQSKVITLNVAEGKTLTIAGSVKAGTIAATGAGTVRLTAANAYTGGTTIGAGATLELEGGSLGTGAVTVAAGATIAGSGTIGGTLTLVAGSTVDATDGSLTVNGDVTLPSEGEVTVKVAETAEAGDTVITCANAEAVAAALTGAPAGLKYVADGMAVKLAAATPVSNNVAKIGDTEYETLQAAFEAAGENATVELLADTTENITVPAGFTGTIDLGEKTVTGYLAGSNVELVLQNGYIIHNTGEKPAIKITGGSLELNNIYLESHYHGIQVDGTATCIINSGTYKLTSGASGYALVYPYNANASITVNGGNFYGAEKTSDVPALFKSKGLVTVNGGYFQRNLGYTVYISSGNVVITGGEFNGLRNYTGSGSGSGIVEYGGGKFTNDPTSADARERMASGYKVDDTINPGYYTVAKAYNVAKTIDATKVTVSGLNDAYACGGTVSFTVAANEGYNLTGVMLDGEALTADENGKYTFTMPEKDVAIVVTTESTSTFDVMIGDKSYDDAEALKDEANSTTTMTVPEGNWTAEGNVLKKDDEAYVTFADYYTVVVDGTTVTLKLNKPVIGESAEGADDAFTVSADAVTIKITNYNKDLKYGVRIAADISGLSSAAITPVEPNDGVITLEKSGDSAFYEVVVSDVEIPATPAE